MTRNQPYMLSNKAGQIFFCNFYNNMRKAEKEKEAVAGVRLVFAGASLRITAIPTNYQQGCLPRQLLDTKRNGNVITGASEEEGA